MKNKYQHLGFSLIELVVVITVIGLMAAFAIPSFGTWVQNSKTRTLAESLQNGIRLAQTEAVNRGTQITFFITADQPSATAASATTGSNWTIKTAASNEYVQGATFNSEGGTIVITSSVDELRFNSIGRLMNGVSQVTYIVSNSKGDRNLNVIVTSGGSVRMCDPNRSVATSADGC